MAKIPLTIEAFTLLSLGLNEYKKGSHFSFKDRDDRYSFIGVLLDLYCIRTQEDFWEWNELIKWYEFLEFDKAMRWAFGDNYSKENMVKLFVYSDKRSKLKSWPSSSQLKRVFWFDDKDAKRREKNRKPKS